MAKYGFEIEFNNLSLQFPDQDNTLDADNIALQLQSTQRQTIDIIPDAGRSDGTYVLEARSKPSTRRIDENYFSGLTEFIQAVQKDNVTYYGAPGEINLNDKWKLFVKKNVRVHYNKKKENLVFTHATFGFNEPYLLEPFYNNFKVCFEESFVKSNIFSNLPFSEEARILFDKLFIMSDEDEWPLIEFLRFYIGQALRKRKIQDLRNGNKDYLSIMNRMSFRTVYQPLEGNSATIINYIKQGYTKNIPDQPFQLLGVNDMIFADPYNDASAYPEIQNTYTNNVTLSNFLGSIFSVSNEALLSKMNSIVNRAALTKRLKGSPDERKDYVNASLSYIKLSDWLSPVPYSMQDDSMGLYPRYPDFFKNNLNKFILEVRSMGRKLQSRFFDENYKKQLAAECSLAASNWEKPSEE